MIIIEVLVVGIIVVCFWMLLIIIITITHQDIYIRIRVVDINKIVVIEQMIISRRRNIVNSLILILITIKIYNNNNSINPTVNISIIILLITHQK